jgi:hypothetical protein
MDAPQPNIGHAPSYYAATVTAACAPLAAGETKPMSASRRLPAFRRPELAERGFGRRRSGAHRLRLCCNGGQIVNG